MGRVAKLGFLFSLLLSPAWLLGLGEEPRETKIQNWSAPPYWHASQSARAGGELGSKSAEILSAAVPFVAMPPCRLADTRGPAGPYGAPPMAAGVPRNFTVVGQCGIPSDAQAVSFNFTVVRTMGLGYLVAFPQGGTMPGRSWPTVRPCRSASAVGSRRKPWARRRT
jgi:hypothetical protein